jgi:hypothetical protein
MQPAAKTSTHAGYRYGRSPDGPADSLRNVVHGEPHKTFDGLRCGTPNDAPANLGLATAESLEAYLVKNDLGDLRIEVGHYDPSAQWRALRANPRISGFWKYGPGFWSVVGYSLVPGRAFGRNSYNPYTDTLSVNSDDAAGLLQLAAVAKRQRERQWPGSYAATTGLPGLGWIRSADATGDVIAYARAEGDWELERSAYRELYPRIGAESVQVVGPVARVMLGGMFWMMPVTRLAGRLLGRGVGWFAEREAARRAVPAE